MQRIIMTMAMLALAGSVAMGAAKIGDKAPVFSGVNHNGTTVRLADLKGKVVVLEWFNDGCPYVRHHYAKKKTMLELASKYAGQNVVWLAINSTKKHSNKHNKKVARKWKIPYPIINDQSGKIGKAYKAKSTPHMFIIDKQGKLVYSGAIDNAPLGRVRDKYINYVSKALDEIIAGKPVTIPRTRPYGCGIKYAKK